jgi:hypothetical protein
MTDAQPKRRRPGRPRKTTDPLRGMYFKLSAELYDKLIEHTDQTGEGRSAFIRKALEKALNGK